MIIYIGVCEIDFSGYFDCCDVFVKLMNVMMNLVMDYNFNICILLMYFIKKEMWKLVDELGVFDYIFEYIYICYLGVEGGCYICLSCVLCEKGLNEYFVEREKKDV